MGMFDTFYGKIKCPYCDKYHNFEEQTKSYDCMMDEFKLGDYIDKANATYVYPFDAYCEKNSKQFNGNIVIVKGQIVKIFNDHELKNIDINNFENIEEGLGWKLEYEERCKQGIGFNNDLRGFGHMRHRYEKVDWNEHPKKIGDRLFALNNDWLITAIYIEKFIENEDKENNKKAFMYSIDKFHFKENYIYKITNKLGNRIARVTKNYIELMYDNGFKSKWDSQNPHDYFIQGNCELIKL